MLSIILSLCMTAVAFLIIIGVRNELVFKIRTQATELIYIYNVGILDYWAVEIAAGRKTYDKDKLEKELIKYPLDRGMSYLEMVFDLTKWTMGNFYPDLIEIKEKLENK